MAISKISVFRIDYETEKATWVVFISAYSSEEAVAYLKNNVKDAKIRQIGHICRLDALSNNVRKSITGNPIELEKTKAGKEENKEGAYICPWCNRAFSTGHALKIHIVRVGHVKTKEKE